MFESYSKHSVSAARASLKILDAQLDSDLAQYPAPGIPSDREWQFESLGDMFLNSAKKQKARKRADFNAGVIYKVCEHHFDGKPKHFEDFCLTAIKGSTLFSGTIAKMFKKSIKTHSFEFRTGIKWGGNFVKRHITDEPSREILSNAKPLEEEVSKSPDPFPSAKIQQYYDHMHRLVVDTQEQRINFYAASINKEIDLILETKDLYSRFSSKWGDSLTEDDHLWFRDLSMLLSKRKQLFFNQVASFFKSLNKLGFNLDAEMRIGEESLGRIVEWDSITYELNQIKGPSKQAILLCMKNKTKSLRYNAPYWLGMHTNNFTKPIEKKFIGYEIPQLPLVLEHVDLDSEFSKYLFSPSITDRIKNLPDNFDGWVNNELTDPSSAHFALTFEVCLQNFCLEDLPLQVLAEVEDKLIFLLPYEFRLAIEDKFGGDEAGPFDKSWAEEPAQLIRASNL